MASICNSCIKIEYCPRNPKGNIKECELYLSDEVTTCPHCFCMTHTIEGKCGKCKKEKK